MKTMTYYVIEKRGQVNNPGAGFPTYWSGDMWVPEERRALHFPNAETAGEHINRCRANIGWVTAWELVQIVAANESKPETVTITNYRMRVQFDGAGPWFRFGDFGENKDVALEAHQRLTDSARRDGASVVYQLLEFTETAKVVA